MSGGAEKADPILNLPPLIEIYRILRDHFGHRGWWPGDSPIEIIVGAILTQNTAWSNVEKAIENLKKKKLLHVAGLRRVPLEELAETIRPSGYFNQKAARLKTFVRYLDETYQGSLARMKKQETHQLRRELLDLKGIGPETADSILLYALEKKIFVVDAYTRRIFARHYYFQSDPSYHEVQQRFEEELPEDTDLYNDFHAQIVATGNRFCKPNPRCDGCPLEAFPHRVP